MPRTSLEHRLHRHLEAWLGVWPPRAVLDVVESPARARPAWDGRVHPVVGVGDGRGVVLSVPPRRSGEVSAVGGRIDDLVGSPAVGAVVGRGGHRLQRGVFRAAVTVPDAAALPDAGEWVDRRDDRLPDWLRPFNGGVLAAFDAQGRYGAGVGVKRHDDVGCELAVVTEPEFRGRGLARRLVAQAARRVIRDGGIPTYLHAPANAASARVAEAAGFPDRGWSVYSLFPPPEGD
jgi:GNAT superfamily N-acetyltransferase